VQVLYHGTQRSCRDSSSNSASPFASKREREVTEAIAQRSRAPRGEADVVVEGSSHDFRIAVGLCKRILYVRVRWWKVYVWLWARALT
jgi:hypothetical protein